MATEGIEAFKLWLSQMDIDYGGLDPAKKVSFRAQYDQAHPETRQG
jgi:hypothetical protein